MCGNGREDCIQRANPKRMMLRYGNTLMTRLISLKNDMAPNLMNSLVYPTFAKVFDQILTA